MNAMVRIFSFSYFKDMPHMEKIQSSLFPDGEHLGFQAVSSYKAGALSKEDKKLVKRHTRPWNCRSCRKKIKEN